MERIERLSLLFGFSSSPEGSYAAWLPSFDSTPITQITLFGAVILLPILIWISIVLFEKQKEKIVVHKKFLILNLTTSIAATSCVIFVFGFGIQ